VLAAVSAAVSWHEWQAGMLAAEYYLADVFAWSLRGITIF